jgi:predicted nucleic acid-binding protein
MESPNVERVNPTFRFNLITADPDDNKFVDCAIIAGATYIVSNDRHFNELRNYNFPKVEVRNLAEFLDIVKAM